MIKWHINHYEPFCIFVQRKEEKEKKRYKRKGNREIEKNEGKANDSGEIVEMDKPFSPNPYKEKKIERTTLGKDLHGHTIDMVIL